MGWPDLAIWAGPRQVWPIGDPTDWAVIGSTDPCSSFSFLFLFFRPDLTPKNGLDLA